MDELTIGDKIYISSKRAAAITGYAKDYVGQLCREGQVEAKMVGRSWYVLESSIRAQRFGKSDETNGGRGENTALRDTEAPKQALSDTAVPGLPETWEASTYTPQETPGIPGILPNDRIPEARETPSTLPMSDDRDTLTEMQTAWKEWFENKHEPLLESPDVIEAREEAQETEEAKEPQEAVEEGIPVPIVVHRIPEARQPFPIRPEKPPEMTAQVVEKPRSPTQAPTRAQRSPVLRRRKGMGTNLVAVALLLAAAGIAIAIGVIGSGFADTYLENNPIIKYLGGTSSINK